MNDSSTGPQTTLTPMIWDYTGLSFVFLWCPAIQMKRRSIPSRGGHSVWEYLRSYEPYYRTRKKKLNLYDLETQRSSNKKVTLIPAFLADSIIFSSLLFLGCQVSASVLQQFAFFRLIWNVFLGLLSWLHTKSVEWFSLHRIQRSVALILLWSE